jgi:hypothetical protein
VTGASGAGKTAMVQALAARDLSGVTCAHFDAIVVPPERDRPSDWQETTTRAWIARLAQDLSRVCVLDGQTRPSLVHRVLAEHKVPGSCVLVDCAPDVREARLADRGQPELATLDMRCWAAYLRGQADALALTVIDTTALSVAQAADALAAHVHALAG